MNNKKVVIAAWEVILFILLVTSGLVSAEELGTLRPPYVWDPYFIPVYPCCQIADGAITVDGKLDETCWTNKLELTFQGLPHHSKPDYHGTCRILWDSKYLYIGYDLIEPDVWATIKDAGKGFDQEKQIMGNDMFVKFFIDPDGDGLNYIEIHINPANAVADLLVKWPYSKYARQECGLPLEQNENPADWDWGVTGLITAVHVDGTLNNSQDVDRGWSVEMALPWNSIQKYANSPCPPVQVRNWRCHVGRVHRQKPGGERIYWTWPVFDVFDCHAPAQWGILVFTRTQSMGGKIYSIFEKNKMAVDNAFSREKESKPLNSK